MGAAATIISAGLGLLGAHKQARAAKEAAASQERAAAAATKVKATDIVKSTESKTPDSAELGSSNRAERRRGKNALTISRTTTTGGTGGTTSTGLTI
jgi:hypothetical protein|nr:MAG TPA: hypothetical protein [Caudoviricetes sp.]